MISTDLYEFAFIAGSQLLDVTHKLALWYRGLFLTRTQQRQGCKEEKDRGDVISIFTHTHQLFRTCGAFKAPPILSFRDGEHLSLVQAHHAIRCDIGADEERQK